MNLEQIITPIALAVISVAALTTVFGRKSSPAVIDSLGNASSNVRGTALGVSARGTVQDGNVTVTRGAVG